MRKLGNILELEYSLLPKIFVEDILLSGKQTGKH